MTICMLHLFVFSRLWNLGLEPQFGDFADSSTKLTAILGFSCGISFLLTAVAYILRKEWYWIFGIVALVLLQALIVRYWEDAKYATIATVLMFVALAFSAVARHFHNTTAADVRTLKNEASQTSQVLTTEMIVHLPQTVQRWLHRSDVVGQSIPTVFRVTQTGSLRTTPNGRWMPFKSEQHFSIDPPAFVWVARIKAAPFISIAGRDEYRHGHGRMLIKPLYLFNAADHSGKEIDQGTLLRFLAEMSWFPQAAASRYLRWDRIDNNKARVTMEYEGVTASGVYTFNNDGLINGFEARRFGEFEGIYRKETWSVLVKEHRSFNGIPIGHKNEVTWKLKEGDFTWLKMEVTEIENV